jgi:hypothetical protein
MRRGGESSSISAWSSIPDPPKNGLSADNIVLALAGPPLRASFFKEWLVGTLFLVTHIINADLGSRAIHDRFVACYVWRSQDWYLAVIRFA